jgi:hypothetical protein
MKSCAKILLALLIVLLAQEVSANPRRHFGYDRTSIGFRAGWVGAPNGFTMRRVVGNGTAFEFVAGYNGKYARRTEMPQYKKGNTFIGASFAPFFLLSEGNLGVALTGDLGARLNYHHYRYIGTDDGVAKITPEVLAGLGMQVEFSESVEIFADVHVKYFNEPHGDYVPGIESGLGIRFALH